MIFIPGDIFARSAQLSSAGNQKPHRSVRQKIPHLLCHAIMPRIVQQTAGASLLYVSIDRNIDINYRELMNFLLRAGVRWDPLPRSPHCVTM